MMNLTSNIRNVLVGMAVMVVLVEIQLKMTNDRIIILDAKLFQDDQVDENTKQVRDKRTAFSTALRCEEAPTRNATLRSEWYTPPNVASSGTNKAVAAPVHPCTLTILDLGVGRGESLGWFIDAGIPSCPTGGESNESKISHYDIETGMVLMQLSTAHTAATIQPNTVTAWAYRVMLEAGKQTSRALEPEEYCYYGVEENNIYTSVLHQLGTVVLQSQPRPLRQVHFYTETTVVAAAVQGVGGSNKSKLQKSGGGDQQRITLSRLLKETVDPTAGNHVMMRLHGDNAYSVINEAFDSGSLCAYAERAVRLDILVQFSSETTAENDDDAYERFRDIVKGELHICGVHVRTEW